MAGKDFTDKQLMAIDLLAQGVMQKDIEEQVGVSHTAIWTWKKNPQFMDAVLETARVKLKGQLPDIYTKLAAEALAGNHRHIKILLDHLESLSVDRSKYADTSITFTWEK